MTRKRAARSSSFTQRSYSLSSVCASSLLQLAAPLGTPRNAKPMLRIGNPPFGTLGPRQIRTHDLAADLLLQILNYFIICFVARPSPARPVVTTKSLCRGTDEKWRQWNDYTNERTTRNVMRKSCHGPGLSRYPSGGQLAIPLAIPGCFATGTSCVFFLFLLPLSFPIFSLSKTVGGWDEERVACRDFSGEFVCHGSRARQPLRAINGGQFESFWGACGVDSCNNCIGF